jgi:hypothetical protein
VLTLFTLCPPGPLLRDVLNIISGISASEFMGIFKWIAGIHKTILVKISMQ